MITILDILEVAGLSEPTINHKAIDRLVMRDPESKETIKAICRQYLRADDDSDRFTADFVEGKGEGQIFLLHGPPGTGKTLTAGMFRLHHSLEASFLI